MSNNDHLRPVSSPPALASVTARGLLPTSPGGQLLIPLPNERRHQIFHVRQLFGSASQLQSTFANGLHDPDCPSLGFKPLELRVDTGQVVVQFAVARDIRSDAPVIKSVGRFGEVSVNGRGANQELVEPGREGFNGLRGIDGPSVDGERVGWIQGPLLLAVCLYVPVVGWGNPVGLGIASFTQWDLEVRVHSIADVSVGSLFIGFGVPFNG